MTFPARERWRCLPRDAAREEYFRVLQEAVTEFYLADPANPYQQSGRSSGAERWEETRRCLLKAVDVGLVAAQAGFAIAGRVEAPGVAVAWIQRDA
jgi:hypothetical protein